MLVYQISIRSFIIYLRRKFDKDNLFRNASGALAAVLRAGGMRSTPTEGYRSKDTGELQNAGEFRNAGSYHSTGE